MLLIHIMKHLFFFTPTVLGLWNFPKRSQALVTARPSPICCAHTAPGRLRAAPLAPLAELRKETSEATKQLSEGVSSCETVGFRNNFLKSIEQLNKTTVEHLLQTYSNIFEDLISEKGSAWMSWNSLFSASSGRGKAISTTLKNLRSQVNKHFDAKPTWLNASNMAEHFGWLEKKGAAGLVSSYDELWTLSGHFMSWSFVAILVQVL